MVLILCLSVAPKGLRGLHLSRVACPGDVVREKKMYVVDKRKV